MSGALSLVKRPPSVVIQHGYQEATDKENQRDGNFRAVHVAWFRWGAFVARLTISHRALIEALRAADIDVIGVVTKAHPNGTQLRAAHEEFVRDLEAQELGPGRSGQKPPVPQCPGDVRHRTTTASAASRQRHRVPGLTPLRPAQSSGSTDTS